MPGPFQFSECATIGNKVKMHRVYCFLEHKIKIIIPSKCEENVNAHDVEPEEGSQQEVVVDKS